MDILKIPYTWLKEITPLKAQFKAYKENRRCYYDERKKTRSNRDL